MNMLAQSVRKWRHASGLSLVRKNSGNKPASRDASDGIFYSESNIRYLEGIMRDVHDGRAHFAEHDLIEID